jgi:rRNA maturation endonuclease Nob1
MDALCDNFWIQKEGIRWYLTCLVCEDDYKGDEIHHCPWCGDELK